MPLSYAAPAYPPPPDRGIWRDGNLLVMRKEAKLPSRCCVCNELVGLPVPATTLQWIHPEQLAKRSSMNPFRYTIAEQHKQSIEINLVRCATHERIHSRKLAVRLMAAVVILITVLGIGAVLRWESRSVFNLGFWAFLIFGVLIYDPRGFAIKDICYNCIWIRGFGGPYLDSLPPWPGPILAMESER